MKTRLRSFLKSIGNAVVGLPFLSPLSALTSPSPARTRTVGVMGDTAQPDGRFGMYERTLIDQDGDGVWDHVETIHWTVTVENWHKKENWQRTPIPGSGGKMRVISKWNGRYEKQFCHPAHGPDHED